MNKSTSILLYIVLVGSLCFLERAYLCEAAARLIHVLLERSTTLEAGQLGQPIVSYHTNVLIGTPPKSYNVQFDVGLSELFVPHISWNPFKTSLHYNKGFQCKVSSTCHKTDIEFTFDYQNNKMTGKRYDDVMILAQARTTSTNGANTIQSSNSTFAGVNSPSWRQTFLAISSANDGRFSSLPIDGFFGLSPSPQSQSAVKNLLLSLHDAKQIDNLQFSIWFNPIVDSTHGGELILGGVDTSKYQGQIYWHHLLGAAPSQWALNLQKVILGNQVVSCADQHCQAILSTGLSDIVGPYDDVRRIYSYLNTVRSSNGLELIDCRRIDKLPHLIFDVDSVPYHLLPINYIRKIKEGRFFKEETCYVAILPANDNSRNWILSIPFMNAYYNAFDLTQRQVGFAALRTP